MTQKMTVEEFKAALLQGEFKDLGGVYNEQTQTSYQARVFNRLRFQPKVSKLLFVPMILSFHFDVLTGESTEEYNFKKRFRPGGRPDVFLMGIKALCHEDPELKKKYIDYAGFVGEWNTKPTEFFTANDRKILFIYRRPMTVVHPAIRINSMSITGEKYGGHYLLDTVQDPLTGEYQGDISPLHKLGMLSNDLQKKEVSSFNAALEEQKADCISLNLGRSFITTKTFTEIKDTESDPAKQLRGMIRSSYPLGGVSPLLVTPMLGFDVTPVKGLTTRFVPGPGEEEVEELLPQFRSNIEWSNHFLSTDKYAVQNKINEIAGNAFPKDPSRKVVRNEDSDIYANYVVMEYITDSTAETFATDAEYNTAAQKMEAKVERTSLFNPKKNTWLHPDLAEFDERLAGFYEFAEKDNFIKRMPELMFSGYRTANESITERAIGAMSETFSLGEEYKELFTSEILATHSDILKVLWPDDFAERFDEIEDKIDEGNDAFEKLIQEGEDTDTPTSEQQGEEGSIGAEDPELIPESLEV